ncbi:MAG: His/Gly/Thr/Pro-type tRNA ligase C-terminal domain-containing protein, partial [bacterium]
VMFHDMELIGIPYRLVIGERGLDAGQLEFKARTSDENESIPMEGLIEAVLEKLA